MAAVTQVPNAGWLIGLMSGTSADGIDAALLWTDGERLVKSGATHSEPYDTEFRQRLMACYGGKGPVQEIERELTERHADCVRNLLQIAKLPTAEIVAVGFHGQTILHAPRQARTWQLGDGLYLARNLGISVVNDFRSEDMAHGGQGAPLVPVFHQAIVTGLERPAVFLNLGGVANVTWIGERDDEMLAFDTGPANALIDDWVRRHAGFSCDLDGAIASRGRIDEVVLARLLTHPYFREKPPKSLDRDEFREFGESVLEGASLENGAATLTAFSAASIALAGDHFPAAPKSWIACGGGRRNKVLMNCLSERLGQRVKSVDELGWDGDALEAMAFAYLAMRSLKHLPLSFPGTTGVRSPQTGGRYHPAP